MAYNAFISYRRSDGGSVAKWLRRKIINYRLPHSLRKNQPEKLSVYLDEIYDYPSDDFWTNTIEPALFKSEYLVIISTPDAIKQSDTNAVSWMEREIAYFLEKKGQEKIIIVLANGKIEDSIPSLIREVAPNTNIIDIRMANRWFTRITGRQVLADSVRTIAAQFFNIKDELMPVLREEERHQKQKIVVMLSTIALLVIASIGYLLFLNERETSLRQVAEVLASERKQIADANRIVVRAEQLVEQDPSIAIAMGLESVEYQMIPSVRTVLSKAIRSMPTVQVINVEDREFSQYEVMPSYFSGLQSLNFADHGNLIVVHHLSGFSEVETWDSNEQFTGVEINRGSPGPITVWSIREGKKTAELNLKILAKKVLITGTDSSTLIVLGEDEALNIYKLQPDGTVTKKFEYQTDFVNFSFLPKSKMIVGYNLKGVIKGITLGGKKVFNITSNVNISSLGVHPNEELAAFFDKQNNLNLVDLPTGKVRWTNKIGLNFKPNSFSTAWRKPEIQMQFFNRHSALALYTKGNDPNSISIINLDEGQPIFFKEQRYGEWAIDPVGGKFSALSSDQIRQWELDTSDDSRVVIKNQDEWEITTKDEDVGSGQSIIYGPFGEYILSSSAPIMTNVGAIPGTVKLWFANKYSDNRAGDPHRGLVMGNREFAGFNLAFTKNGQRLAIFSRDGLIKVYDVFPEQAITPNTRTNDYFNKRWHSSLEARALLHEEVLDLAGFVDAVRDLYRVRLSKNQKAELHKKILMDQPINNIPVMLPSQSTSLAIQQRNERDERPNLTYDTPLKNIESLSNYNPIDKNPNLKKVLNYISIAKDHSYEKIIEGYLRAVEDDVLLLSGIYNHIFVNMLESVDPNQRAQAWIALGLSGDLSQIQLLQRTLIQEENQEVKRNANWAISFLSKYGEDLSLGNHQHFKKDWSNRRYIVSFPNRRKELFRLNKVLSVPWSENVWNTLLSASTLKLTHKTIPTLAQASRIIQRTGLQGETQNKTDENFGHFLKENKSYDEALVIYGMLLDTLELEGGPENGYGYTLLLMDLPAQSVEYFNRSIQLGRSDGWPERNLAEAYIKLEEFKSAKQSFESSIKKAEALFNKSRMGLAEKEFQEIEHMSRLDLAEHYNEYAWALATNPGFTHEEQKKSVKIAIKANELTSFRNPFYLDTLAHAHASNGELLQAIKIERKALKYLNKSEETLRKEFSQTIQNWEKLNLGN